MPRDGREVLGKISASKNAAVHFRMQGFDAAVQHFRKSGVVTNLADIETGTAQLFGRAARGQEFDTLSGKSLSKFKCAAFVGKADQGLTDFHEEFSK